MKLQGLASIPAALASTWALMSRRQQLAAVLVAVLSVGASVFEIAALSTLLPFVTLLTNPAGIESLPYFASAAAAFGVDLATIGIQRLGYAVAALLMAAMAIRLAAAWAIEVVSLRFTNGLVATVLARTIRGPYGWLKAQSASVLSQRIMIDATTVGQTIYPGFLELLYGYFILVLGLVAILSSASPQAVLILVGIGALAASVFFLMNPATIRQTAVFRNALVETTRIAMEIFANQKAIKVYLAEDAFVRRLVASFRVSALARMKMILISKAVPSIVLCFGQVGLIVVALAMFSSGASTADLLPQLTLIVVIVARILPATAGLSGSTTKLVKAVPYCEGLRKALAELDALSQTTNEKARPDIAAWQTLALERVGFRHASADRDQLTDVTIAFGRGRRFGIVGPSGAGKSTLVDLILRLIEPTSGRILVDGKTFADFNRESWMSRIGYVAQEVPIIDDTVRRNVAFGVADRQIDDSRIWRALERAGLSDEVRRLSMGLAAPVGDMGGRMSGGQRQRLAIARALYFEPDILLLDEATSGLDPATEAAVLQNLLGLKEDLTLIMVTHRLPTTAICDEVFVLAEGRLAASGTYAQLLANPAIAALLSGAVVGDAAAKADSPH